VAARRARAPAGRGRGAWPRWSLSSRASRSRPRRGKPACSPRGCAATSASGWTR
jgi:hypothetical protein